jgi:hypothetical protein
MRNLKLGAKVITKQDHYEEYVGTVVDIVKMPNPFGTSNTLKKYYRIAYPFRKGSFLTCDLSILKAIK